MPDSVRNILFYFVAHISHVLLYNESCVFVKKVVVEVVKAFMSVNFVAFGSFLYLLQTISFSFYKN